MKPIFKEVLDFRLKCYRKLLLLDTTEDYAIQDYLSDGHEAQKEADRLFTYIDTHTLQPAEEAELLLTIWVALQLGYRNWALFQRAEDRTLDLLPHLPEDATFPSTPQNPNLFLHLLTHLYMETEDEDLLPTIDRLLSPSIPSTEEDRYLLECYAPIHTCIPS